MKTIKLKRLNQDSLKYSEENFWKVSKNKKWYVGSIQDIINYRTKDAKAWGHTLDEENEMYVQTEKNKINKLIEILVSIVFWGAVISFLYYYFSIDHSVISHKKIDKIVQDSKELYDMLSDFVRSLF